MSPRFHLITDLETPDQNAMTRLLAVVGEGLEGAPRVDAVQVRAKRASDREVVAWRRELLAELAPRGTRVVVNDRLDLALAVAVVAAVWKDPDPPGAAREIAELVHTA